MNFVPRIAVIAIAGLAGLAQPAFAGGISPGNGGSIVLPSVLPLSVQDSLASANDTTRFDNGLGQKFGVQNGRLDFFSMRPADSGEFKPLLRGGVGDGGVQLQLKW
jgi:hypothetical protein